MTVSQNSNQSPAIDTANIGGFVGEVVIDSGVYSGNSTDKLMLKASSIGRTKTIKLGGDIGIIDAKEITITNDII